ncbi:uncharacterized protein [Argopecten irradians]|uniref:uncharacterized protein n=1 Tax=Argopecten irradians TaxID=31199 RepID=UPI003721FA2F
MIPIMDNTDPNKSLPETNHNDLDMESQDDSAAVTQDQHNEGQADSIERPEQIRHQPEPTQPEESEDPSVSPSEATTAPPTNFCKIYGDICILIFFIVSIVQCANTIITCILVLFGVVFVSSMASVNNSQTIGTPGTSADNTELLNSSEENLSEEGPVPNDTCSTSPCQLEDNNIQDLPNRVELQTAKPHCYSSNGLRIYQPSHDDDDDDVEIYQDLHNPREAIHILSVEPEPYPSLLCSGSSLKITDSQGLQEATGPASQSWLSECGNPVCYSCFHINRNWNGTLGEDDMEILAHQELLMSNSTTADDVGKDDADIFPGRYPVELDHKNNLRLPKTVCKLMAEHPTKTFRVTPCPKTVNVEIADPTDYLVDSGYNGTSGYNRTLSSAPSQQLECPPHTSLTGAEGFQQPTETQASSSFAKLKSLGGTSSDPNYEVNIRHDNILPTSNHSANPTGDSSLCDILFVHEGYAMFTLSVPRGIHVNTLITTNQFKQQKAALLGEETPFYLQEGAMNLAKVKENSVINIVTLTEEPF